MRTHSVFQNRSDDAVLAATSPLACWLKVFKDSRHSSWYPVLTFTDSIQIVIQNDSHDDVATNDGGLISSSSSYVVQAYRRLRSREQHHGKDHSALGFPSTTAKLPPRIASSFCIRLVRE